MPQAQDFDSRSLVQETTGHLSIPETLAAGDQAGAVKALLDRVRESRIRRVDFHYTELAGRRRRMSVSTEALDEKLFSTGIVVDGRSIGEAWEGFIQIQPDLNAVFPDPLSAEPVLTVMCDVAEARLGGAHLMDSRQVLKRAEAHLRRTLPDTVLMIGAEPEFFLLDGYKDEPLPEGETWDFLRSLASALRDAGVLTDWFRTGPYEGEGRVQIRAAEALRTADHMLLYKGFARSLARKAGKRAVFLPKALKEEGSAGLLVHVSLWREGKNLFHDPEGWALTSPLCRRFAAGLIAHAPALSALCAPSTNSYRRLIPGSGAPTDLILSIENPAAICRIPARSASPGARRVKFASADTTANPYLAFAAMIMAGLDGIENELEPPLEAPQAPAARLPRSLEEALSALELDHDFLKLGGVLSDGAIEAWIQDRWTRQALPMRARPHPMELRREQYS